MFGYVRVNVPELKVREHEFYRGTYCGLCRAMGKCTGQCSRFALSYDFAFLALIRLALGNADVSFAAKRCIAHPLKKRNYMKENAVLDYCASAAALLNYHKVMDDIGDERGAKKARARLLRPFMAHARKKALRNGLAELDVKISNGLAELSAIESSDRVSVDEPARAFGKILADIMSFGLEGTRERIACSLGTSVGKWIYIADALDDWKEDAEKGRYNPFLKLYGGRLPCAQEIEGIRNALKNELYNAEASVDLIDFENDDIKNIVLNIIYLGMPRRVESINAEKNAPKKNKKDR